jgi:transposase
MVIIGVDAHKATHTAVGVDRNTGEVHGDVCVPARNAGHAELIAWGQALDEERVWAIEDCRSLSGGLEVALLEAGERVLRVPPKMMAAQRKAARSYGKSDPIDALAVARAAMHEPSLPEATLPGIEQEIGLLVDHRQNIVQQAADDQRRLKWHLHQIDPDLDTSAQWRNQPKLLERLGRVLARREQTARVRICRDLVKQIRDAHKHARVLEKELAALVRATHPELLQIVGCGALCAATIIGEIAGAGRFASDAQLASYAGVAPLDASSGRQQRHRLNRHGNRRLNRALHIIAVTQLRMHPPARDYAARRTAEGKTGREVTRALKRYIARSIFNTLNVKPLAT